MILYLITDRRRLTGASSFQTARQCLLRQAAYATEAGIDGIVLRERDLEARDLADISLDLVTMTRGTRTRILVSDRLDVALATGADGVHLRADSMPAERARELAAEQFLIGRSIHSPEEAATTVSVDYLIAGTVWPTESKSPRHRLLGLDGFSQVVAAARVPVLGIGGVTLDRVADVAMAGGAGVAAIGLFMTEAATECRATPLRAIVESVRLRFDTSRSGS